MNVSFYDKDEDEETQVQKVVNLSDQRSCVRNGVLDFFATLKWPLATNYGSELVPENLDFQLKFTKVLKLAVWCSASC